MKFRSLIFSIFLYMALGATVQVRAQGGQLASRPVQGHSDESSIKVWLLFQQGKTAKIWLEGADGYKSPEQTFDLSEMESWVGYTPRICEFTGLPRPDSEYRLLLEINGQPWQESFRLRTFPQPGTRDFSFLTGSCAFVGGGGLGSVIRPSNFSRIFDRMREKEANFMLWLGDNVYYINGEWSNRRRRALKNIRCRLDPKLALFLEKFPQYAGWDDHDFGPNDSDSRFPDKAGSLRSFLDFWPLPPTGTPDNSGLFYRFSYQDADFFVLDDRYYRLDSGYKQMIGPGQMAWLKENLLASQATFKFVVVGGQVLNDLTPFSWYHFQSERAEFFDFINKNRIPGLLFISGDRHFTELDRVDRPEAYPLYDFTCSPLTAWVRTAAEKDAEATNPMRVQGTQVVAQNFGRLSIIGPPGNRTCRIEVFDMDGNILWTHEIPQSELSYK